MGAANTPPPIPTPSYTPMWRIAALFCVVGLLAGCASQRQYQELAEDQTQQIDSLRNTQDRLRQTMAALRDSLQFYDDIDSGRYYRQIRTLNNRINKLQYEVAVALDDGVTVTTLQVDDLFEPGTTDLTEDAAGTLDGVAELLNGEHAGKPVRVEGHSDSVPVGGSMKDTYPSNWELAGARAAAVARYLIQNGEVDESRVAVVSYGAARPLVSNATAQGRSENRRVRISVLPEAEPAERAGTDQALGR
ncbi:MAG TPA: OmpA family protein [Rhodothermales bacterium]|nr:OmpA family protein [Rhodothermales bacterium]